MDSEQQYQTHDFEHKQKNNFKQSESQNSEENQFSSLEEHNQIDQQKFRNIEFDYPSTTFNYQQKLNELELINEKKLTNIQENQQQSQQKKQYKIDKIQIFEYPASTDKDFQKQFQQIRFNSIECNLMDFDIPQDRGQNQQNLKLEGYNYQKFIQKRIVFIQSPQLINQGYITSYKLYQIKTKKEDTQSFDTCVGRRFSDFQYLNQLLIQTYGGYIIPNLPEKNFWATINLEGKEYKEVRTKSLQKYLNRLLKHKKLRLTKQIKSFLFEDDSQFSANKGQYTQKKNNIEDKLKTISTGAIEYGKYFYNKLLQFSYGNDKQGSFTDESMKFSTARSVKITKQDLSLGQYELIVGQLMRITKQLKILVQNTIQQIKRIEQLKVLFNYDTYSKNSMITSSSSKSYQIPSESISIKIQNDALFQQYEELCQFIQSCYAAILRRNELRSQISSLCQQQQILMDKYKNAPRNSQLDIIRSKLSKLRKINQTYTSELLKELQIHADEGKGMLKNFIQKFQKIKVQFFGCSGWGSYQ